MNTTFGARTAAFFSTAGTTLKTGAAGAGKFITRHKILSGIVLLAIIGGGYYGYTVYAASTAASEYVLSPVVQAPLNVTVTGSGQVSAQDTLNLTPQASGEITYLGVAPGDTVKAGTLIAELDMTTAAEAVTSARQDLESAQISYQQTLSSSGSSVTNDQTSLASAQTTDLTALSNTYTSLPTVMDGLNGILYNLSSINNYRAFQNVDAYTQLINTAQSQAYNQEVKNDYTNALASYQKSQADYSNVDPNNLTADQITKLDTETVATDKLIELALKDTLSYYNYINDQIMSAKITATTQLSSQLDSLTTYQSTVTSDDSSVTNAQASLLSSEQSITQDTQSLGDTGTPLNVQSAELSVQKAQEALNEAITNESNYEVRAPFDGVIATVPVHKYDQASSGTTVATLITTEEYADLSLNETDAAKVKVGQPVSITFDAITGLTMPGTVAVIDPVGTVSAGVVTYDVKISFSQQDSRIKPGMTAEATITTASEPEAIQVPSAAVKTIGNFSYVQVATLTNASSTAAAGGKAGTSTAAGGARRTRSASSSAAFVGTYGIGGGFASSTGTSTTSATTPMISRSFTVPASEATVKTVPVTLGISNDTMTEILTGLTPGEYVVTATQSAATNSTKSSAASATSLLGGTAGRTGGGGFTGAGGGGFAGRATGGGAAAGGGRPGG